MSVSHNSSSEQASDHVELTIGEVAALTGLATSAIRYYEQEGLIETARRRSGRRVFGHAALDRLAFIEQAKNAGLSLEEIRRLIRDFDDHVPPKERWKDLSTQKVSELDQLIEEAEQMKALLLRFTECPCQNIDHCGETIRRLS